MFRMDKPVAVINVKKEDKQHSHPFSTLIYPKNSHGNFVIHINLENEIGVTLYH